MVLLISNPKASIVILLSLSFIRRFIYFQDKTPHTIPHPPPSPNYSLHLRFPTTNPSIRLLSEFVDSEYRSTRSPPPNSHVVAHSYVGLRSPNLSSRNFGRHLGFRSYLVEQEEISFFTIVTGGIVALGNFDALHIGHRELAIQASRIGTPYLLSFVGMPEE
ncbi:unnamed protein product [Arabis nemorensis]|uniref:FAD synthase n=1 Tax=Arabis nemorensis TaxID=586526 RepID=A0A565BVA3_9BRAS|nr:unnamed protein product [Arabis nemorensis]